MRPPSGSGPTRETTIGSLSLHSATTWPLTGLSPRVPDIRVAVHGGDPGENRMTRLNLDQREPGECGQASIGEHVVSQVRHRPPSLARSVEERERGFDDAVSRIHILREHVAERVGSVVGGLGPRQDGVVS